MIFVIDIDGTLCTNNAPYFEKAKPYINRIDYVNRLYKIGHTIIIYTARGSITGINWSKLTKNQLKLWGVKYHKLLFGKPYADIYIDDKSRQDSYLGKPE